MDKQSRLSALPYLMVEQSTNSSEFKVQFTLVNHGVGPAIIEGRKIIYNGKEYDQDFHQFMTQSIPELKSIKPINWHNIYKGQAIPSNGRVVMFAIGGDEEKFNEFMNVLRTFKDSNTFEFEFDYRSVYGDKWRITNQNTVPVPIE
ncbi:hypothetical protein [Croceivirga thetidis]|uniref:DUF695 domain-containing protein n=1 Tax=Croceivirga thetidis TaxID=2721623 RepID=A0ABX1GTI5_9FLAO|nr:hypothetical protein [Croceivirga thetidis]NKI32320.1 hypothetical protein [Croceivirga thetidis]